jgi:hypothetical protein
MYRDEAKKWSLRLAEVKANQTVFSFSKEKEKPKGY